MDDETYLALIERVKAGEALSDDEREALRSEADRRVAAALESQAAIEDQSHDL